MFGAWGNPDHDDSIRIIHRALDAGINFVDTADVYSRGESEEIVGKALAGRRDDVVLATKVHGPWATDPNQCGNSRRWIVHAVEDSLRRLQHRLDRPLPDPPPRARHRHRRDARRADRPRPRRQDPLRSAARRSRRADRRGAVGRPSGAAASASSSEQPPYSLLVRGDRARRAARVPALRDGRDPWSPLAGGWLSGKLPQGRRAAETRAASG